MTACTGFNPYDANPTICRNCGSLLMFHQTTPTHRARHRHQGLAMSDSVKVTVTDPATGEVLDEQIVTDDYVLVCAGSAELTNAQVYAKGTHVLTVRGVKR